MKNLTRWYSELNIYFRLIPFLILYVFICIAFAPNENVGDEKRYLFFANNLLNGFYSPPYPNINLLNGPGYPAFLVPFLFLKLPLILLRLLNGVLLYFSLIISFKTFCFHSSKESSFLFTIVLGLYFPIFEMLPLILTESLTWFLICLICFLFLKSYNQKGTSWRLISLAAFSIAYLVMTKVIFGYVIILMIAFSFLMLLLPDYRVSAKKSIMIFLISFAFCIPWLLYTYSLTNKIFYWTNTGSSNFYTMSTPYVNELGDWSDSGDLQLNPNHKSFMDSILKLDPLQIDEAYKTAAIKNIKTYPKKYFTNWIANVGRMIFSYPYSQKPQTIKCFFTLIANMFVIVLIIFAFTVSIVEYKRLPEELIFLFMFFTFYLLGSSLLSAYRRIFYITVPFWFFFISYVLNNLVSIKIKLD